MSDLSKDDLTTIAKALHRSRKDLERSRANAERRDLGGVVGKIDLRLNETEAAARKVRAMIEGFTP